MGEAKRWRLKGVGTDRWMYEIIYTSDLEPEIGVIAELSELQNIVERGPEWCSIEQIVITLNRNTTTPTAWPLDDVTFDE